MSLERMFQQIMQSEQTAKSRRESITKIKRQIAECEAELKSLRESCTSSRGRLHIYVRQYHEENAECMALIEQRKALEERRDELKKDIESRKERLEQKRKNLEEIRDNFSKKVIEFCSQYDLTGDGTRKREQEKVDELKKIRENIKEQEKELEIFQAREENLSELLEQRGSLQTEISRLQTQIIEVDSSLEKKRSETSETIRKVQHFRNQMHLDPELVKLQKEFDSIKNHELEQKVRNLKAELARVKRQKWQESLQGQNQPKRGPSPREYKFKPINQTGKPY